MLNRLKYRKWAKIIHKSGLFDAKYYLFTYCDVREQDVDPLKHFIKYGAKEGRNPSEFFDTKFYLNNNSDIDINKINPLIHYILHGKQEQRLIRNIDVSNRKRYFNSTYLKETYNQHVSINAISKKIILVSHDAHPYGAQYLALNILKELIEVLHYDVEVILAGSGDLVNEFEKLCIVHHVYKLNSNEQSELFQYLKKKGFSKVIANTGVVGNIVENLNSHGFDIISLIHEMSGTIKKLNLFKSMEKISVNSKKVIFPTLIVKNDILKTLKMDIDKIEIKPQGLFRKNKYKYIKNEAKEKLCKELGISINSEIILNIAYGDERKGLDLFIKIASNTIQKSEKYHFVWVGGYNQIFMKKLKESTIYQNISNNIHFVGYQKEIEHYYAGSDFFFLSSREDPFPSVILDAMNCFLPVVGFANSGGIEELVQDDLLLNKNNISESSNKFFKLITNKELRKIGENNEILISEKFSFHKYVIDLLAFLNEEIPKVSVIVPCYNHELFIKERLESIMCQSAYIYEIIFLDDKSTDNSVSIAKEILQNSSLQYKIIINKENSGSPFKQWKKGINLAQSEIIWIAEGDDTCSDNFLSTLVPYFDDPLVNIATSKVYMIDENGNVNKELFTSYFENTYPNKFSQSYIRTGNDEVNEQLGAFSTIINASGVLIRKSSFGDMLNKSQDFKMCGDWLIYLECIKNAKIAYDVNAINYFRRHSTSQVTKIEGTEAYFKEREEISKYVLSNYNIDDEIMMKMFSAVENEWNRFKYKHSNKKLEELYSKDKLSKIAKKYEGNRLPSLAVVVSDLSPGGGQLFGIRLVNAWQKIGGNVVLLNVKKYPDNKEVIKQIDDNVPLFDTSNINLSEIINVFNVDVIHSTIWWADKYVHENYNQIPSNVKWVLTMHGCYESLLEHQQVNRNFLKYMQEMLNEVSIWVYTAEKNKKIFEKFHLPKNITKILNGYEPEKPKIIERKLFGIDDDSLILCLASRAIEPKGWYSAIETVNNLSNLGYKIDLLLIGEGIVAEELKKRNLPKNIHLIGQVSNLVDYINMSDVGILPTTFIGESMPLVLIEFMAQGKPIISTDIGEIKNMISDTQGSAGIVIEPIDMKINQNQLNDSVLTLLKDKNMFKTYSMHSKRLFEKFKMPNMIEKYKKVYAQKKLIVLATQRNGSTMVCDDIAGTNQLGKPSEYFIKVIDEMNQLSKDQVYSLIMEVFAKGKSDNDQIAIKIMSNQIRQIGMALQKSGLCSCKDPEKCFYTFFKDSIFCRVVREDKVAQAVSRIVAFQTNIYHSADDTTGLEGMLGKVSSQRNESNLTYNKDKISSEIKNIMKEETYLDTFIAKYNLKTELIIYEKVISDRSYIEKIAKKLSIDEVQVKERRLKKISGSISKQWIEQYKSERVEHI